MPSEVDLDQVEAQWVDEIINKGPDEEAKSIVASNYFDERVTPIAAIDKRRKELGLGDIPANPDQYDKWKIVNSLCKATRGQIEKNRKIAVRPALDWCEAINGRAKQLTAEVDERMIPIKTFLKGIDDAKEAAKRAKEEAERQAIIDAENARLAEERAKAAAEQAAADAKRAAEAEANRAEQKRLLAEREALEVERKKMAAENARIASEAVAVAEALERQAKIERDRIAAEQKAAQDEADRKAREERDRLNAELNAKLAKERSEQAERDRIANEAAKVKQAEMAKIEAELAEFRAAKAKQEDETKRLADEEAARIKAEQAAKAEAARLAKLAPDIDKVKWFGKEVAKIIDDAPEVASDEAAAILQRAIMDLSSIANDLQKFGASAH